MDFDDWPVQLVPLKSHAISAPTRFRLSGHSNRMNNSGCHLKAEVHLRKHPKGTPKLCLVSKTNMIRLIEFIIWDDGIPNSDI